MTLEVNVVQYFKHKHGIDVWYPDLPCIQLGSARNCIPMEFVTVLGGASDAELQIQRESSSPLGVSSVL